MHKYARRILVCLVAGLLLIAVVPLQSPVFLSVTTLGVPVASLCAIFICARSPILRRDKNTWPYFTAFILYLALDLFFKLPMYSEFFMPGLPANLLMILSYGVTDSRNRAEALSLNEERVEELQTVNNAMKELIENIAHDLKTPLSVLSVHLERLVRMSRNGKYAEYRRHVDIAYDKNLDLQRLLRNLYDVSRIETSRSLYNSRRVPLSSLLSAVQQKYDEFLEEKGIDFDVSSYEDAEIMIDPQKIWSVFDNIIYNAARHTAPGGTVCITAEILANLIIIRIRDTGEGIDPAHLPHIFDRFYKAPADRGASSGNSGLGLYIVKSIMEGIEGAVCAESEPGKGTVISLEFRGEQGSMMEINEETKREPPTATF